MEITNKKAFFDHTILERLEAGIALHGAEVKAVKSGHADLSGSYVRIIGDEAFLINAKIFPYEFSRPEGFDENRTRKLLLHRQEIVVLKTKTAGAGLTIVPISLYLKSGLIKIQIAIAKSKKAWDKKQAIKKQDLERDLEADLGIEGY